MEQMAFAFGVDSSGDCLKGTQECQTTWIQQQLSHKSFKANSLRSEKKNTF